MYYIYSNFLSHSRNKIIENNILKFFFQFINHSYIYLALMRHSHLPNRIDFDSKYLGYRLRAKVFIIILKNMIYMKTKFISNISKLSVLPIYWYVLMLSLYYWILAESFADTFAIGKLPIVTIGPTLINCLVDVF